MENEPWSPKMSVCLVISGRLQLWRHSGFNFNARTNQKVCSDQHSAGAGSKLPHDHVTLLLVHVAVLETGEFCERGSKKGDAKNTRAVQKVVPEQRRWSLSRASSLSASRLFSWCWGRWQPGWSSASRTDHTGCPASTPGDRKANCVRHLSHSQAVTYMETKEWCDTGPWDRRHWTLRKRSPHRLIFNPVPLFSFPGVPVLTWPHELNRWGLAPAVPAGCFWWEGLHFVLKTKTHTHLSFHVNVELLDTLQG